MNAAELKGLLAAWAALMNEKKEWLIELDSVVGDSDLGLTMSDGFAAAAERVSHALSEPAVREAADLAVET